MTEIVTILSSGTLSALITAALVFLFKNWISERIKSAIQHEYDQKLETHKAQLKAQSEISIEQWKAELARQHFQFSHVFKKTEEIIAETYQRLLSLKQALERYTILSRGDDALRDKLMNEFWENANGFKAYFDPNKIYIPKNTVIQIDQFTKNTVAASLQFVQAMTEANLPNRTPESYGTLFNQYIATQNTLPKLLELLEDDFQRLLGFPIENTKSAER